MPFSYEPERVFVQVWVDKLDELKYLVGGDFRVVNLMVYNVICYTWKLTGVENEMHRAKC